MAVAEALRSVPSGERPFRRRLTDALLLMLAVGLACSITLSELTLLTLFVVLLAGARPGAAWLRAPLATPLLAFAGSTLISAAMAMQPGDSLRASKGLLTLATFWIVLTALPDAAAARRFATIVFVTVSAVGLLSIVQVAGCVHGAWQDAPRIPLVDTYFNKCARAHGFFSIYMTLAGVLTVVLILTLPRLGGFARAGVAAVAWVGGAVALGLTLVRGAWFGFAVGAGVTLVLARRRVLALGLLVIVIAAALALPAVHERLQTIGNPADDTTRDRLAMLKGGLRLVREHPVSGIGPGQVKHLYPVYAPADALRRHTSHLHDTPLQIVVERGVVGLALWLWIFVAFFARTGRILRRVPASATADRALVIGAVAAVAAFLVAGLFEYNFGDTEVLLVTLAAMALPFVVERSLAEGTA